MRRSLFLSGLLAIASLLGMNSSAKADNIDEAIKKKAPDILKELQKEGIKTVGVLRFRIQEGKKAESFQVSHLNSDISNILENALILNEDKFNPVMITKDTNKVASNAKVGDWLKDVNQRKKLFSTEYPAAWGKSMVKPDAFLTGVLKVPADKKQSTLVLEVIKKSDTSKIQKLMDFTFNTDAGLVANLGHSFVVPRGKGSRTVSKREADDFAFSQLGDETTTTTTTTTNDTGDNPPKENTNTGTTTTTTKPSVSSLSDIGGINFRIKVGERELTATAPESASGQWKLESANKNDRAEFVFTNNSDKELGVLIRVNGQNVIMVDEKDTRKFVPKPGKTYTVKGFSKNDKNLADVMPFKFLTGEEAETRGREFGDKAGEIAIEIYEKSENGSGGDGMTISSYGLRSRSVPADKYRADLDTLQSHLARKNLMKSKVMERTDNGVVKRYSIIVPDEEALEKVKLTEVEFPNPVLKASVVLKLEMKAE